MNRLLLFRHINHAATAFANLLEEFVAADAVARFLGGNDRETYGSARSGRSCCGAFEEGAGFFAGLKELFDALTQGGVTGAGFVKISGAFPRR